MTPIQFGWSMIALGTLGLVMWIVSLVCYRRETKKMRARVEHVEATLDDHGIYF